MDINNEKQINVIFDCDYCQKEKNRPFWEYKKTKKHFCSQTCAKRYRNVNSTNLPNIGDRKHKLTLIEIVRKNHKTFLKCKCDCDNETLISRNKFGVTQTCGDKTKHKAEHSPIFKGHELISLTKWNSIKHGAKIRGLSFSISIHDAWDLFLKQRGLCALTGVELNLSKNNNQEITASLDRIDSNNGYELTNIQWVHKTINQLKMDLNINDFKQWCYKVSNKSGYFPEKLDFNQVLLLPKPTNILSRNDVDLTNNKLNNLFPDTIPIIAANFDTVGSFAMAKTLSELKLMTCLSKHYDERKLIEFINNTNMNRIFYSMGVVQNDLDKFKIVLDNTDNIPNICIDVAHAENPKMCEMIEKIKTLSPNSIIMVGNIATPYYIEEFSKLGVKIIKTGIGSGGVCTTRLISGVGVPQFSAIIDCVSEAERFGMHICSDGGCVHPGDVAKAFGAGASMVMLGSMLSGTDQCEGDWFEDDSGKYLVFYGMSSNTAMKKHGENAIKNYRASEGRTVKVKYKGSVIPIINQILGGIRSACTYQNARTLFELSEKAEFIKVTNTHNTIFESTTMGN